MNEADTRAELIDPALAAAGWGVVEDSRIRREHICPGRIQLGGRRGKSLSADYVLVYRGRKLAALEAKSDEKEVGEGVGQAKDYATRLNLDTALAANGREIYQICMKTGQEGPVDRFPTPQELWDKAFTEQNDWRDTFRRAAPQDVPGQRKDDSHDPDDLTKAFDGSRCTRSSQYCISAAMREYD